MLPHQDKYQGQLAKIRDKYQLRKNLYDHSYQQENMQSSSINSHKLHKHYQVPSYRTKQLLGNSLIQNQSISTKNTVLQYNYQKQDKLGYSKINQYENNYRRSVIINGKEDNVYKGQKQLKNNQKEQAARVLRTYSKQTENEKTPKYLDKYKDALEKAYQYGKQIGFKFRKYQVEEYSHQNYDSNLEKLKTKNNYTEKFEDHQESLAHQIGTNNSLSRFDTSFSFGKDNSPEKKRQQREIYDSPIKIIKQAEKQQAIQKQQQPIKKMIEQSTPFQSDIIKLKPIEIQQDRDMARLDNIRNRIDSYIQRNKLKY